MSSITQSILNRLQGRESSGRFGVFLADDAGLISIVSSYSGQNFGYRAGPADGDIWLLKRLQGQVFDTAAFDSALYGTNIDLTTGDIEIGVGSGTVSTGASIVTDLLGGQGIRDNAHWGRYTTDLSNVLLGDNEFMAIGLDFDPPIRLSGADSDKIFFVVQSDFRGLLSHTWFAQGLVFTE